MSTDQTKTKTKTKTKTYLERRRLPHDVGLGWAQQLHARLADPAAALGARVRGQRRRLQLLSRDTTCARARVCGGGAEGEAGGAVDHGRVEARRNGAHEAAAVGALEQPPWCAGWAAVRRVAPAVAVDGAARVRGGGLALGEIVFGVAALCRGEDVTCSVWRVDYVSEEGIRRGRRKAARVGHAGRNRRSQPASLCALAGRRSGRTSEASTSRSTILEHGAPMVPDS